MDDATLDEHVEEFHRKEKLEEVVDLRTLQRGAWLVRNPKLSETYHGTARENMELQSEDAGELRSMTKALRVLFCTCAIGAIVQYVCH